MRQRKPQTDMQKGDNIHAFWQIWDKGENSLTSWQTWGKGEHILPVKGQKRTQTDRQREKQHICTYNDRYRDRGGHIHADWRENITHKYKLTDIEKRRTYSDCQNLTEASDGSGLSDWSFPSNYERDLIYFNQKSLATKKCIGCQKYQTALMHHKHVELQQWVHCIKMGKVVHMHQELQRDEMQSYILQSWRFLHHTLYEKNTHKLSHIQYFRFLDRVHCTTYIFTGG